MSEEAKKEIAMIKNGILPPLKNFEKKTETVCDNCIYKGKISAKLYVLRLWWVDELSGHPRTDDFVMVTNDEQKAERWVADIKNDHDLISKTPVTANLYIADNFQNIVL